MAFQQIGHAMLDTGVPLAKKRSLANNVFHEGLTRTAARLHERGLFGEQIGAVQKNAGEQYEIGEGLCESPIERMVLAALVTADWRSDAETLVKVSLKEQPIRPQSELIIAPQFLFIRCRLDFAVMAFKNDGSLRIWAIECDGKEFHKDAVAQRKRDMFLNSWGISVLHISGQEITRDAHGALSPVVHSINSWRHGVADESGSGDASVR